MAPLTVRNLEDDLVRSLRIRAAENDRSAEAEHRDILRQVLTGAQPNAQRAEAAARLAAFRQRTAARGSAPATELLRDSREARATP